MQIELFRLQSRDFQIILPALPDAFRLRKRERVQNSVFCEVLRIVERAARARIKCLRQLQRSRRADYIAVGDVAMRWREDKHTRLDSYARRARQARTHGRRGIR